MMLCNNQKQVGGLSLLEVLIVIAALALLIVVLLPRLAQVHRYSGANHCVSNLKQIALSFQVWANDHNDRYPMQDSVTNEGTMELTGNGIAYVHFLVISNELNTPNVLVCPADNNHIAATNWTSLRNGNLSYFVGLDATEAYPQTFLSGDDNFTVNGVKPKRGVLELRTNNTIAWLPTRHSGQGNVALADGSVQEFSSVSFRRALTDTGVVTNRLLMP
jgi:prepilin-type processing-associated H-X9-DG protein